MTDLVSTLPESIEPQGFKDWVTSVSARTVPVGGKVILPVGFPLPPAPVGYWWADTGETLLGQRVVQLLPTVPAGSGAFDVDFSVLQTGTGIADLSSWTPADLFASGEQGGWYDPSDLSTMFQLSTGTTAVAVGDPVGYIADKSGRGNHLTQANAAFRPVLRQNGGLYYLEFDGVDDTMSTLGVFTIAAGFFHANALSISGLTGAAANRGRIGLNVPPDSDSPTTRCGLYVRASGTGGASTLGQALRISGGANFESLIGTAFTVGTPVVVLNWHESQTLYNKIGTLSSTLAANIGATSVGEVPYTLQHRVNEPGMKYYGGLYIDREPTAQDRTQSEAYLAEKSGVTL
jgi:hypothetical protein